MSTIADAYRAYCSERFSLPSEADITALEERIQIKFPPEYRSYLMEYNGGVFARPLIAVAENPDLVDQLRAMKGIHAPHDIAELCRPRDLALFDQDKPIEVISIGYTAMNYLVTLIVDLEREDYGCVFLKTFTEWYFLAETLSDFFALLHGPWQGD